MPAGGKDPLLQLPSYKEENKGQAERATDNFGIPPPSLTNSLTVGPRGSILLQDTNLIDHLAAFDRERIPERVVHAKGAGAFGYFEATHDISHFCKAKVFAKGQKTPIAIRFSTVGGELGSADTARDPRGFAVKFYTDDGVWDLVGNNTPIFFLRDPMLFPSFIHTQKRNPQTHLKDPNMMWDFISLRPETLHQVSFLFSERGLPDGFRFMHGFGSHTFKLVNSDNKPVYCKFHMKSAQGIKNLDPKVASELAGSDPDYSIRDLYDAILNGNFPAWNMFIQVMTFDQAESVNFDPFDLTKVWSQKDYPLLPVGKLVLNRNPTNYFNDVEQIAFCPGNMPPGIEASPDRMLQGRLFSYKDTQRHRLGPNFHQIPVNRPIGKNGKIFTYTRDGLGNQDTHQGSAPHYFPNSFGGPTIDAANADSKFSETGDVQRFDNGNEDNYSQVKIFWEQVLSDKSRQYLAKELGGNLAGAIKQVRDRTIAEFSKVSQEMGDMIKAEVEARVSK